MQWRVLRLPHRFTTINHGACAQQGTSWMTWLSAEQTWKGEIDMVNIGLYDNQIYIYTYVCTDLHKCIKVDDGLSEETMFNC